MTIEIRIVLIKPEPEEIHENFNGLVWYEDGKVYRNVAIEYKNHKETDSCWTRAKVFTE